MSTNKVYGDNPNKIKLDDCGLRYDHFNKYINGIPESFNIDSCIHSIFGVNKLYSDLITQEYGKNLGIKTCIMRCGCLTGGKHKGAELHGFLSYLTKCIKEGIHYEIHGYQGKQVRDNIHSYDVWSFINEVLNGPPIYGQVFNLGGGRENSTSVLEAVSALEAITEKKLSYSISNKNRTGDHKWYISDLTKISVMYPEWRKKYKLIDIYIDLIK
jgi:CDP-paratose 2-epimerase